MDTVIVIREIVLAGDAAYSRLRNVRVKSDPTEEHAVLQAAGLQTQLCCPKPCLISTLNK